MKILAIEEHTIHYVSTDQHEYCRIAADNWEIRIGESWEPCFFQEQELERKFQEYKQESANV